MHNGDKLKSWMEVTATSKWAVVSSLPWNWRELNSFLRGGRSATYLDAIALEKLTGIPREEWTDDTAPVAVSPRSDVSRYSYYRGQKLCLSTEPCRVFGSGERWRYAKTDSP